MWRAGSVIQELKTLQPTSRRKMITFGRGKGVPGGNKASLLVNMLQIYVNLRMLIDLDLALHPGSLPSTYETKFPWQERMEIDLSHYRLVNIQTKFPWKEILEIELLQLAPRECVCNGHNIKLRQVMSTFLKASARAFPIIL